MTNLGELVSALFSKYERTFHDHEVAAVATQVVLEELLREQPAKASRGPARKAA